MVSWEWSEYLDLHISIINGSPMTDTIQVKMENAQIEFTAVVAERLVEGLSHDSLTVRLKQTDNHWDGLSMGGTNLITFTVRSSNDSNIEVARSTLVYITPYMDRDITSAYLPIILKK
ncbi:MAG: hypothetical protein B6242_14155 [Anaerolineaceae bacterium 4572_78]|nr:MAG: hypothetical protein B6242_14155 [Anaerolineaceae bacterium 4572_78]